MVLSALSGLLICALLRVFASEMRVLAYFQNYLLAAALFGLAFGALNFYLRKIPVRHADWLTYLTLILVLLTGSHFSPVRNLGLFKDSTTFFHYPRFLPDMHLHELTTTLAVFAALFLTMRCFISIGDQFGALSSTASPVHSLSVFLAGSIAAWSVYALSVYGQWPPLAIFGLLLLLYLMLYGPSPRYLLLGGICLACVFSFDSFVEDSPIMQLRRGYANYFQNFWAPYYHVQTLPLVRQDKLLGFSVTVNHNPYTLAVDAHADSADAVFISQSSEALSGFNARYFSWPYLVKPHPARVLILGAGIGNEVAAALQAGAGRVDAVDSQEWLFRLGKLHPQKPYQSPRVHRYVGDPRQFLRHSTEKYDLIVYGMLESQTAFSPFGELRPDDFIYTIESFLDARERLASGGCLVVSYVPVRGWYLLKLAHNLLIAFGSIDAELRTTFRGYLVVSPGGNETLSGSLLSEIGPQIVRNNIALMEDARESYPSYDDRPFSFLVAPLVPQTYLYWLTLILLAVLFNIRFLLKDRPDKNSPAAIRAGPVFGPENFQVALLAGAGQVAQNKAVMTLAFVFGTTWTVAVFATLISLFCASLAVGLFRRVPAWLLWLMVFLSLTADHYLNYEALASISNDPLRLFLCTLVPILPVFFIYATLASGLKSMIPSKMAMGFWFCGLAAGLIAASVSLVVGISNLDWLTIMLCACSLLVAAKQKPRLNDAEVLSA